MHKKMCIHKSANIEACCLVNYYPVKFTTDITGKLYL